MGVRHHPTFAHCHTDLYIVSWNADIECFQQHNTVASMLCLNCSSTEQLVDHEIQEVQRIAEGKVKKLIDSPDIHTGVSRRLRGVDNIII
jgi:hypothetical protein